MTRVLRAIIIVSVVIGSAIAIVSLLVGSLDDTQGKLISTSFIVAGAGLLVLAAMMAYERDRLGLLPSLGALASTAGAAMLITALWMEVESDAFANTMITLIIVGTAVALLSLLSLARLGPRYRWLLSTGNVLLGLEASASIALVWWEDPSEWAIRSFGVLSVLLAAAMVTIPVMHLARRSADRPTESAAIRYCALCGSPIDAPRGEPATCATCGATFTVTVLDRPSGDPSLTAIT